MTKNFDGSNGCDQGVFSLAAAYDKWVGRYLIAAICDDWLRPRVVLAVSATDSVTGYWNLYSAPAEHQGSSWKCSNGLRAWPDYAQARPGGWAEWELWGGAPALWSPKRARSAAELCMSTLALPSEQGMTASFAASAAGGVQPRRRVCHVGRHLPRGPACEPGAGQRNAVRVPKVGDLRGEAR